MTEIQLSLTMFLENVFELQNQSLDLHNTDSIQAKTNVLKPLFPTLWLVLRLGHTALNNHIRRSMMAMAAADY